MLEPFFLRALLASLGLAVVAAPLGCFVVWQRMAYFGETVAQAGLIGVALGLALQMDITWGVLIVALAVAALLLWFSRQKLVALDSVLGLLHHAALAAGVIATSMIKGTPVDLTGFLFGDVFAVTGADVAIISSAVPSFWRSSHGCGSRCCALPCTRSWRRPRASTAKRCARCSSFCSRWRSRSP